MVRWRIENICCKCLNLQWKSVFFRGVNELDREETRLAAAYRDAPGVRLALPARTRDPHVRARRGGRGSDAPSAAARARCAVLDPRVLPDRHERGFPSRPEQSRCGLRDAALRARLATVRAAASGRTGARALRGGP